jgi:TrmH family RNA methyltransferase
MPLQPIASRRNALLQEMRRAFQKGELTSDGYCAIESVRIVEEAIRSGLKFKALVFSESGKSRAEPLLPQMSRHTQTVLVPDAVFKGVVMTESPQGVAALVKLREHALEETLAKAEEPLLVVAVGIQDPGNLGTIVRSAEAFSATAVLVAEGTVSPFNAKAVRASAGSLFRLPVMRTPVEQVLSLARARGMRLLGASSHAGTPLEEVSFAPPAALFLGNEASGLPRNLLQRMDQIVSIPHAAKVESLNAGIAASILLYEAGRQRRPLASKANPQED